MVMNGYISFSIMIVIVSWIIGLILIVPLKKTTFYTRNLSNLNFIKSELVNKYMGVGIIKWMVKNTFFKFFNPNLKLNRTNKISREKLAYLRSEMTSAEIGHLIGFAFVCIFALMKLINLDFLFGFTIMVINILMNLYPSLLQQENKRRIDKLSKLLESA